MQKCIVLGSRDCPRPAVTPSHATEGVLIVFLYQTSNILLRGSSRLSLAHVCLSGRVGHTTCHVAPMYCAMPCVYGSPDTRESAGICMKWGARQNRRLIRREHCMHSDFTAKLFH